MFKKVGLVGVLVCALLGAWFLGSNVWADYRFLHYSRLNAERIEVLRQLQQAQKAQRPAETPKVQD